MVNREAPIAVDPVGLAGGAAKINCQMREAESAVERFCTKIYTGNMPGSGVGVHSGGWIRRVAVRCACAAPGKSNPTGGGGKRL